MRGGSSLRFSLKLSSRSLQACALLFEELMRLAKGITFLGVEGIAFVQGIFMFLAETLCLDSMVLAKLGHSLTMFIVRSEKGCLDTIQGFAVRGLQFVERDGVFSTNPV